MNTDGTDMTQATQRRSANVRTAVVFVSIALCFFVGVFATRLLPGPSTGVVVMGSAVLLFLLIAIGRHLRAGDRRGAPGAKGASPDGRRLDAPDAAPPARSARR